MRAIRCQQCAGAVAARPGERIPRCLFCGADALVEEPASEDIEQPEVVAPFVVGEADARTAFRTFASSSWWYPSDLGRSGLDLERLLIPAWAFRGTLEVHWTGLVSANNKAGKRPVAGNDTLSVPQVLVPASRSLLLSEIRALGPFDESALVPFSNEGAEAPYELSELSRSSATEQGLARLEALCSGTITSREGLLRIRTSTILRELHGRPVLVPVWIGAYRYQDRTYRVLVHGQTGHLVGRAPKSLWKMLFAVTALLAILAWFAVCITGGGLAASLTQ